MQVLILAGGGHLDRLFYPVRFVPGQALVSLQRLVDAVAQRLPAADFWQRQGWRARRGEASRIMAAHVAISVCSRAVIRLLFIDGISVKRSRQHLRQL